MEHLSQIVLAKSKSGLYIWQLEIYRRRSARRPQRKRRNGPSPTDYDHQQQRSSQAAGWVAANKPRVAERSTLVGTAATHL